MQDTSGRLLVRDTQICEGREKKSVTDSCRDGDEMYEIAYQTKYRFLGVDEMYKIRDG